MIRSAAGIVAGDPAPSLPERTAALFLLAKPGIVGAIALSGFTGMVVAGGGLPEPGAAFACITSLILAAAGSAMFNCLLERRMDARMGRLSRRAVALERAGVRGALACAWMLTAAALVVAVLFLNAGTSLLLAVTSLGYTVYYTVFLKRRTHWAAILGGIPGALPVLIGPAALGIGPTPSLLLLFLVMILWQPPHFWLLALSHQEQYRSAGVPVLPLTKGVTYTKRCVLLFAALLIPATVLLALQGPCSRCYGWCAILLGISFFCVCALSLTSESTYQRAFRGSIAYLLALFILIIADLCLRLPD